MQEEENSIHTVGFADYLSYYESRRKLMEERLLAERQLEMIRKDESSSSQGSPYDQRDQASVSLLPVLKHETLSNSELHKASCGRGHLLLMTKHINARLAKKSVAESYRSMPIETVLKSNSKLNEEHLNYADGIEVQTSSSSTLSIPHMVEHSNSTHFSRLEPQSERETENTFPENCQTLYPKSGTKDTHLPTNSTRELPMVNCYPSGMTLQAKPSQRNLIGAKGIGKLSYLCGRLPSIRASRPSDPQQSETMLVSCHVPKQAITSSIARQGITETSHQSSKKPPTNQGSNMSCSSSSFVNPRKLLATLKDIRSKGPKPLGQESCTTTSPSNAVNLPTEDDDMKELLNLARGSFERPSDENAPTMLKLSKLAELIEDGRVLVRSDFFDPPTHDLKDFAFDSVIHEALKNARYEKPKTIQAYVWQAILRGYDVAYVAGDRTGKTLGYLIPILNNLLDQSAYSEVPAGCSPLMVVICSSWENAEVVNSYCRMFMKKVADFRSAVFTDSTVRNLQGALPFLINGVTVLVTTAPALSFLLEESKGVISFDRCCHLVFDDADVLLQEHGEATKKLFNCYQESFRRTRTKSISARQIVACASHWTKGMEILSSKAMKKPSVFISSSMEAAIYGGMKIDVRFGTPQEMDSHLIQIMREKVMSRTIIFCRGSTEVFKVEKMLQEIGITPLLAHNGTIVSDLDFLTKRWDYAQPGSAILICTDDVLERIAIKNAQTLIHYFIPHHSKYDFSYRLSFAMDNFMLGSTDVEKPETHLLITKEFNNSLLTIVRFMQRFGHSVSDELATEAILSFCGREVRKKSLPLCETLKAFGFCPSMKFCGLRHVMLETLDQPLVPRNGVVRIRITAVRTANQYFARILKHRNEEGQLIDWTGSHFEVDSLLRSHFRSESNRLNPVQGMKVEVGNLYARRSTDELFERVRVESITDRDHQKNPIEVDVVCIDQGCVVPSFVSELFELPDNLKSISPAAVEIFLVGAKPLDRNTSWSRYSIDFAREKLMSRELDGRIVLSLSSTLWLQPLHERKRLEGFKSTVVVGDILKDLLTAQLAEKNEEHIVKLHHLCEAGGIILPNYNVGLDKKANSKPIEVAHAFLPTNQETEVELVYAESVSRFYVTILKFQKTLQSLEEDIKAKLSTFKTLTYEDAQVGTFCLTESPSEPGTWCRCCIKKKIIVNDGWDYHVFFVDYGDYNTVHLNGLRTLPNHFISRLPFQAIACSLFGVAPTNNSDWTKEDATFFMSLTRTDGFMDKLHVEVRSKETGTDEVTNGPHYRVSLKNRKEVEPKDVAQQMISENYAIPLENEEEYQNILRSSALSKSQLQDTKLRDKDLNAKSFLEDDDELKFDVSTDWLEFVYQCSMTEPNSESKSTTSIDEVSNPSEKEQATISAGVGLDKSLTLIDHTMPLKDNSSRFPVTTWWQNEQDVFVTFVINLGELYNLELTENHLKFVTEVNGLRYELSTSTYGYIVPEKSSHALVSNGVKAILRKQEVGALWTRLIYSPVKQHWLTRDYSNWSANLDESDDEKDLRVPIVEPKYAFEQEQPDSSSSDSDEDCADERWMRDDD